MVRESLFPIILESVAVQKVAVDGESETAISERVQRAVGSDAIDIEGRGNLADSIIRHYIEQHLSPEVTGAIGENNEALLKGQGPPPEMIVATAMFADLKGYSGITADFLTAGQNREFIGWLNRYLQAVIPLIRAESMKIPPLPACAMTRVRGELLAQIALTDSNP